MKIRVLIVDDEPLGRQRVHHLLQDHPDFTVAGECIDGKQAIRAIRDLKPDLVFLDVQMPEMNGLEVLAALPPEEIPMIIFVTAHDQFAVKAFEAEALDYLLKPFEDERFEESLRRVKAGFQRNKGVQLAALQRLVEAFAPETPELTRLGVKTDGRVLFLKLNEIDWMESAGNYIKLHVRQEVHVIRGRLSELEKRLNPNQFFRIHRSIIVNLDSVREVQPLFKGDGVAILKNGVRLSVSRDCSRRLQARLTPEL